MKLHIGCGTVYLDGYTNIDMPSPNTFLAEKRPDLVRRWKTTDAQYYAKHEDKSVATLRQGPLDQEMVCDVYGSFDNIPAPYWSVDELLARHVFEHLSLNEAHKALDQVDAIMQPNGLLRLDVPDHEETLRLYHKTGDEFYIRHLLGPRKNERGFHVMSYTRDRLRKLVEEHGFVFVKEELPNIHIYPAFTLCFVKPGPRAACDYIKLPSIPENWKVLEIGPGKNPLPRANVYLDIEFSNLNPLQKRGASTIIGDLRNGLPQIADKEYDYVFCAHVLEHMDDPTACAATLSRIAKCGTVVLPSAMKDGMFAFEELEHQWHVLPNPRGFGPPVFVRQNPIYVDQLRDVELQKITSRLYRTGPNRVEEARYLRKWFYDNEHALDVVHHWENELRLQVIQ